MNFIKSFSTYLLVIIILMVAACKKDASNPNDALAYMPATATSITAIDLKKLLQKADFKAIQQMDFYKEMVAKSEKENPQLTKVLLDPAASGINLEGRIYSATAFDEQNPEQMATYFYVPLKDAGAFEAMWKYDKDELSERDGIKILDSGSNALVGWNNSLAVFAFSNDPDQSRGEALVDRLVTAFKVDKENTLTKDASLQKALSANHDITSWLSTNSLAKNSGAGFALNMIDVEPDALKDNFISSYADFEKGKMVGHSDFIINDKLGKDFIGRFFKDEVKADFSKVLPNEKLTFATVMALDLVGIDKFLSERPKTKDYADFVLNDMGIKRKDMIDALGGDMMIAGFGGGTLNNAKIQVSLSLKNEAKAKELLQVAVTEGKLKELEPGVYTIKTLGNEDFNITVNKGMGKILLKNGMLTFVSDDAIFNKIKSGETGGVYATALQKFDNQTLAGWFDFQSIWNVLGGDQSKAFKNMDFKVNSKGADFILETTDPNTNSLKAFIEMMNEGYKQRGKMPEEAL